MKIAFNLINYGLGNNGGSLTVVNSANTLKKLGHNVTIIDSCNNQHTWTKLNVNHIIILTNEDVAKLPHFDCMISIGYKNILSTVNLRNKYRIGAIWIRGWESWNCKDRNTKEIENLLKLPLIKIANGVQLQELINSLGHTCHLIRPGYDVDQYYPEKLNNNNNKKVVTETIHIGGQYNYGKKRETKRIDWIFETVKSLRNFGIKTHLSMYGDKTPQQHELRLINKFVKNPTIHEKRNIYNSIDIWLAPTELEGLHIPPAEAMLCEAAVVGTNAPLNGMNDYLYHGTTGLVSDNNIKSFIKTTKYLIDDKNLRKFIGRAGRKKIISLGDREYNMNRLVTFIDGM